MDSSEGEITHYAPHETGEEQENVLDELADAVVLGLRDYCQKSGIQRIVLGLSGGIDSAVAACVAAEAVGPRERAWNLHAISILITAFHRRCKIHCRISRNGIHIHFH